MNSEELKQQLRGRDRVCRAISEDGNFRIATIKNTVAARTAQEKHKLNHISAFLLARTLAASSMLAAFLKGEERIIIELDGNGPVEKVFAEAIQVGEVRGFAQLSQKQGNLVIEDISQAIGIGLLKVSRLLYDKPQPVQGIVNLQKGDVASDLAFYFNQSEQMPSTVILDVSIDDTGIINESGGMILQAMPGATPEQLKQAYEHLTNIPPVTELLKNESTPEGILNHLPFPCKVLSQSPVDFFCRCSKENFLSKLMTLGIEEIKGMQEDGSNELVCRYCNEKYYIGENDFTSMIEAMHAKRN